MIAVSPKAVKLFQDGIVALAQVERNGIKIDEQELNKQLDLTATDIKEREDRLKSHKIFSIWKRRFGSAANLGSKKQLEKIVFDELGYKRTGRKTDKDSDKSDQAAFEFVKEPFVKEYFELEKIKKARGTYLLGIQREIQNSYIYPCINLHTAASNRSSVDQPNIQNFPVRDENQRDVIRRCIIPPKGYDIAEIDFSGIEVCVSACYHKDPNMIKYIKDPTTDMHRDISVQVFFLKQWLKDKAYWKQKGPGGGADPRYNSKNKFVFPEFYGSFYIDCARSLWESIELFRMKTPDGVSFKKHLRNNGITSLGKCDKEAPRYEPKKGTFEYHIKEIEKDFWGNRFMVYNQWKRDWWNEYLECGEFKYLTGFVGRGVFNRKQVCNYPIQGSAFHLLLWALIRLQNWLNENNMKSKIIAEIHDSLVLYLHHKERDDVLAKAKEIMTVDIYKYYKWINVPLSVEAEVALGGGSWADKKPYSIAA